MPGYDGTGPMGRGAMTGRGMGYCNIPRQEQLPQIEGEGISQTAQYRQPVYGVGRGGIPRGCGRGRCFGGGRGFGGRFW
jgi:hypothetical protein